MMLKKTIEAFAQTPPHAKRMGQFLHARERLVRDQKVRCFTDPVFLDVLCRLGPPIRQEAWPLEEAL